MIVIATGSAAGAVKLIVPFPFCSGTWVDCTVTCLPTMLVPWITSPAWVSLDQLTSGWCWC